MASDGMWSSGERVHENRSVQRLGKKSQKKDLLIVPTNLDYISNNRNIDTSVLIDVNRDWDGDFLSTTGVCTSSIYISSRFLK
ncbi:hypothetical protein CASFOL_012686 [Castilleja foliolosa]|uniref:Uncharacterized protein n=1 Tax=Castilleja foliolosa TaxID=1961234 RepID=A0ABD3DHS4_9LAMI